MWLCRAGIALTAAALAASACSGREQPAPELTVAAAVSLSEALADVAAAWRERTGQEISFNLAGSNTLARQILQGAPVDVFVSADERQMDRVERGTALEPGTRAAVAENTLVVVVPGEGRPRWTDASPLAASGVRRIAIGDPEAVPAGVYAKAWLQRAGLWDKVRPRIVPTASVRAALAAVDTASADAAIVYRTDARVGGRRSAVYEIPASESPRIVYYAAVVKRSRDPAAARAFVSFLAGHEGTAILLRHGFASVR